MAAERGREVSARSLARALSSVKSFYGWWAERDGFDATTILSTRAPRHQRRLPRPLTETGARDMLSGVADQDARDWVAARDLAVVTLLYGSGLRISEALSLDAPTCCPFPRRCASGQGRQGTRRPRPARRARRDRPLRRALPP
jgi:integrase/recombinase XerC